MSLSSEQSKQITRKLNACLGNDKQIVTFRQVSREAGCHVNIAKNILLSHARANPSLHITYLLSGPLLSTSSLALTQLPSDRPELDAKSLAKLAASQRVKIVDMDQVSDGERKSEDGTEGDVDDMLTNDKGDQDGLLGSTDIAVKIQEEELLTPESTPRWGVVMAAQEHFEEKRALFVPEGLNIHIYALSPGPISDPAQYLTPNTVLRQYPNYNDPKYGGISGDLEIGGSGSGSGGKALKDGGMDFGSTSTTATKVGSGKKGEAEKKGGKGQEVKVETEAKVGTKAGKKEEEAKKSGKVKVEEKEMTKPGAQINNEPQPPPDPLASSSSTRKPSSARTKKRIITSDDEGAEGGAKGAEPLPENPPTDTAEPEPEPSPAKQTSSMVREDDRTAMEAMMGMGYDDDDDVEEEEQEEEKVEVKEERGGKGKKAGKVGTGLAGKATSGSGRKRRVVKKSKTEMDEKGYMVTKDYTSEESYSGESDPGTSTTTTTKSKPKPKAQTQAKPTPRKSTQTLGGNASQASSVSTELNDDRRGTPTPNPNPIGGQSTSSVGSGKAGGGGGGAGGGAGGGGENGRPVPPPKNVPGKAGKPKGQSTLAGFFTKK